MSVPTSMGQHIGIRFRARALRYSITFLAPAIAYYAFVHNGNFVWALPIYAFVFIPLVECFVKPDHHSLSEQEEQAAAVDPMFDLLLYAIMPIHWSLLIFFLLGSADPALSLSELAGRLATMGILCGIYGINVAHELGLRSKRWERQLSRALLLRSLYLHFIIEHNRGHHRYIATPNDPVCARYREPVYFFWLRSIVLSFISAWKIETTLQQRSGRPALGFRNEMIQAVILQASLVLAIGAFLNIQALVCFLGAAIIGILLLETVNYVEHYGLRRAKDQNGKFVRVSLYIIGTEIIYLGE